LRLIKPRRSAVLAVFVLFVLLLSAPLFGGAAKRYRMVKGADPGPDVETDVKNAWSSFRAANPGDWTLELERRTMKVRRVFGRGTAQHVGEPKEVARKLLLANHRLMRIRPDGANIKHLRTRVGKSVTAITYQQTAGGLPVFNGFLKVNLDKQGKLRQIGTTVKELGGLSGLVPVLRDVDAVKLALGDAGFPTNEWLNTPAPKLGVLVVGRRAHLVWMLYVGRRNPPELLRYFVDARSGQVIKKHSALYNATGNGYAYLGNAVDDPTGPHPVVLDLLDGTGYLQGEFCTTRNEDPAVGRAFRADLNFNDILLGNGHFGEVMSYYHITEVRKYLQLLGYINIFQTGYSPESIWVYTRAFAWVNAYYTWISKDPADGGPHIEVGYDPGVVDLAADADVTVHEHGHATLDALNPVIGFGSEAGAIHEGFSDYWAATTFDNPEIGEYVWSVEFGQPYLRTVDNTNKYPDNIIGEVHHDGLIIGGMLWDIRGALGKTVADTLSLEAALFTNPDADFSDYVSGLIQADASLYSGANSPAMDVIFAERGLSPDDFGDTVAEADALRTDGTPIHGRFDFVGDVDMFKFTIAGSNHVLIYTSGLDSQADTVLTLYDTDGTTILMQDDNGGDEARASRIQTVAPLPAGTYYVSVTNNIAATYAIYQIAAEIPDDHGDSSAQATLVATDGTPTDGVIGEPRDEDWFKFDGLEDYHYTITTTNLSADMDTYIELYYTDGTTILARNDQDYTEPTIGPSRIEFYAPEDGTYYVRVRHYRSLGVGSYTLVVQEETIVDEVGDSYIEATLLTTDGTVFGDDPGEPAEIELPYDQDWFKFFGSPNGGTYTITAQNNDPGFIVFITLYDTDGTTVLASANGRDGDAVIARELLGAPGFYYVRVKRFFDAPQGTGKYLINVDAPGVSVGDWGNVKPGASALVGEAADATWPSIAVDASGTPFVAWQQDIGGGQWAVYVMKFNGVDWIETPTGSASGTGISGALDSEPRPRLAADDEGIVYAVWTHQQDPNHPQIYLKRYSGFAWTELDGSATGLGISGSPAGATDPAIAIQNNLPVVAWKDAAGGTVSAVYLKQFNDTSWVELAGSATGGGLSGAANTAESPHLAVAPDGTIFAAWSRTNDGKACMVYYDSVASAWVGLGGSENGVGVEPAPALPKVGVASAEDVVLGFVSGGTVYLYTYDSEAESWAKFTGTDTGVFDVADDPYDLLLPSVNAPVVVASVTVGANKKIYGKRYTGTAWEELGQGAATGGGIGGDEPVGASHVRPALTRRDGVFYCAYQDQEPSTGVYAKKLQADLDAPTIVSVTFVHQPGTPDEKEPDANDILAIDPAQTREIEVTVLVNDASGVAQVTVGSAVADAGGVEGEFVAHITLVEDQNDIDIVARDTFGNIRQASYTIYLDSQPPEVTVTTIDKGSGDEPYVEEMYVAVPPDSVPITIKGTATDTSEIAEIKLQAPGTVTDIFATTSDGYANWEAANVPLMEGLNEIDIFAKDEHDPDINGHSGRVASAKIKLDSQAPLATISWPYEGALLTTQEITVIGTAVDPGVVEPASVITSVTVNGVAATDTSQAGQRAYTSWSADITLAEGANTITVATADAFHTDPAAAVVNVTVDSEGPQITAITQIVDGSVTIAPVTLPPAKNYVVNSTVIVKGTATDSHPIESVTVGGVAAVPDGGPDLTNWLAVIALPAGDNNVVVRTEDNLGNVVENAAEVIITVDPNADTDGDGMPDWWEDENGLDRFNNDAAGDPDGDGISNLDEYNNGTDPNNADTTVPTVSNVTVNPNQIREGVDLTTELTAELADAGAGVPGVAGAEYFVNVDPGEGNGVAVAAPVDGTWGGVSEQIAVDVDTSAWLIANSPYSVFVRARDLAGNWSAAVQLVPDIDVVDGTPPGAVQNLAVGSLGAGAEGPAPVADVQADSDDGVNLAPNLVDGNDLTYWSSAGTASEDDQCTVTFDLGELLPLGRIIIKAADPLLFPVVFRIRVTADEVVGPGTDWQTVVIESEQLTRDGAGDTFIMAVTPVLVRHVQIVVEKKAMNAGDGLYYAQLQEVEFRSMTDASNALRLVWSATGDDGDVGLATAYDIRYSLNPIDDGNWDAATTCDGEPVPEAPGTSQNFIIEKLASDTLYYIGVKVLDDVANIGPLATVSGRTAPPTTIDRIDILEPADESIIRITHPPTYRWQGFAYNKFTLQFSGTPDFARTTRISVGNATEYTPSAAKWKAIKKLASGFGGTLYWRVYGTGARIRGFSPTYRQFGIDAGAIDLTNPADGADVPFNNPQSVNFTWNYTEPPGIVAPLPGITMFQVEIGVSADFPRGSLKFPNRPVVGLSNWSIDPDREWKKILRLANKAGGRLFWRVRGLDDDKVFLIVSATRTFNIDAGALVAASPDGDVLNVFKIPAFTWNYAGVDLSAFRVEVSSVADFSGNTRTKKLLARRFTATSPFVPEGSDLINLRKVHKEALAARPIGSDQATMYWRVWGRTDDKSYTPASNILNYIIELRSPALITPVAGANVPNEPPPQFVWNATDFETVSFVVEIATTPTFDRGTVRALRSTVNAFYTPTAAEWRAVKLLAARAGWPNMYWRVKTYDRRRSVTTYTDPRIFTIQNP